jgi:hypothetical protein
MKKLLILSVLLGLMALPMFASDITFGGDATFGFLTDFSGDAEYEKHDVTFDVKAAIDDFNSLAISADNLESLAFAGIVQALVTTDIGKWLDLPVGLKVAWGYDDPDWGNLAAISHYDSYSINLSPHEYWGIDVLASYKFLEFELAWNPGAANVDVGYLLAGLAVKEPIKGLSAELYYFQNAASPADEFGNGWIAFDAVYAMEFGDVTAKVGPGFYYNLADVGDAYKWYLAAKAEYKTLVDFSAELTGDETEAFHYVDAVLKVQPFEKAEFYAGMKMSFAAADDVFQGADVGVAAYIGATTMYVGYLITSVGAGEINGYFTTPTDGGFYVAMDVNY